MSKTGRPRKPTEIKKLEGTYRKDRDISKNIPKFTRLISAGEAPDWFNAEQKSVFEFITGELIRINILETVDIDLIIAYCIERAAYFKNSEIVNRVGTTKMTKNGYTTLRTESVAARFHLSNMMALAREFGFTPASRQKLLIKDKDKPDEDPAAKYLNI